MVAPGPLIGGAVLVVFGAVIGQNARNYYNRYTTLTGILTASNNPAADSETVVRGPVEVTEPAEPERESPEPAEESDTPALWAWRVRRKVNSGGERGKTRWRTIEGGVAAGEFAIREEWEHVQVDTDSGAGTESGLSETEDPFETQNLYLGEPEREIPLGELDPVTRRLEKWGLAGEGGILSEMEFSVSVGRKTMNPDRYQDTVVREGDELLVRGELDETGENLTIRGSAETPLLIALGDLEQKASRFRSKALQYGTAAGAFALAGVGVAVIGLL